MGVGCSCPPTIRSTASARRVAARSTTLTTAYRIGERQYHAHCFDISVFEQRGGTHPQSACDAWARCATRDAGRYSWWGRQGCVTSTLEPIRCQWRAGLATGSMGWDDVAPGEGWIAACARDASAAGARAMVEQWASDQRDADRHGPNRHRRRSY